MTAMRSPREATLPAAARIASVAAVSLLAAAVLVACEPAVAPASAATSSAAPPAPTVVVAPVLQRAVEQASTHVGRIESSQRVELRPRVAGHIDAVLFKEGDIVRAGQPLFRIDTRPFDTALERARAELRLADARVALTRGEAERARQLAAEQAIAAEELERRAAAYAESQARSAAAQAAVQAAMLDREFALVRAPISGRIGRALVTTGNYVSAGASQAPLATLVSVSPLHLHFDVAEPALLERLGTARDTSKWRARVLDARSGRELGIAPIDFADNEVAGGAGTLRLRARLDGANVQLMPGQFVRAQLVTGDASPALFVQDKAIGTDQGRRYVLVVNEKDAVEYRPVTVGALHDGLRVITSGLRAGERVVVSGLMRARPGVTVQPQATAMDAPPAAQAAASKPAQS
ncbi:MAG: efflux RND transporter periplasmic adaptor subunit [Burkholderiaceae bacterium]|nr:efflux RND transporter periplasmic adaptor subunit [Burkholderiaceae bacterium]